MEYPWYELVEDSDEITQGDIIKSCPVPIIKRGSEIKEDNTIDAVIEIIDGIILTQACDLANGKVKSVVLCSITSKTEFEEKLSKEGKSKKEIIKIIKGINEQRQHALHIINYYKTEDFQEDYYIINFKDVFSIPIETVKEVALKNGKRLRLCPPYREHLSQAFARFFMRVGLPINIHFE